MQNKQLVHLRDTAHPQWCEVVEYFPNAKLHILKCQFQQLKMATTTSKWANVKQMPRLGRRKGAASLSSSTKQRYTALRGVALQAKQPVAHHRNAAKQTNKARSVACTALAIRDENCEPTSRCGRLIRHPFRHRLSGGYV